MKAPSAIGAVALDELVDPAGDGVGAGDEGVDVAHDLVGHAAVAGDDPQHLGLLGAGR